MLNSSTKNKERHYSSSGRVFLQQLFHGSLKLFQFLKVLNNEGEKLVVWDPPLLPLIREDSISLPPSVQ
jgi:hypothetical protein